MTTKTPRLNITLDSENLGLLATLAGRNNKSLSATAKDLILQALELEEDLYLSKIAAERDKKGTKFISHEDAWK